MPRRDVIAALPDDVIVEEIHCDETGQVVALAYTRPTTLAFSAQGSSVVLDVVALEHDPRAAWRMKERLREEEAGAPLEIPLLPSGW